MSDNTVKTLFKKIFKIKNRENKVSDEREVGIVKWFNNKKGYGFIEPDAKQEDVFAHFRQIRGDGYKSLNEGEKVEFTIVEGKNGLQADDIVRLEAEAE